MTHLGSWLKCCRNWLRWAPGGTTPQVSRSSVRPSLEPLEDRALPTGTGLLGQYYTDQTLTNLAFVRVDPTVNFNLNGQAPAAGMSATNYSVRWTGQLQALATGLTTIYTHSDDGVRLLINGTTVINDWTDHTLKEDQSVPLKLVAGQTYNIEVDYHQDTGPAVIQLFWMGNGVPWSVIPTSQLYPAAVSPPTASVAAPNVTTLSSAAFNLAVTYTSTMGLNLASLNGNDVVVTGPNGFSQAASYIGVTASTPTTWTVNYQITPPGGTWDATDNGTYGVVLQANQVQNLIGVPATGASLGAFQVNLAIPDWFSQNLHDPGITTLARSLDADHQLSRNDMLAIFQEVETETSTVTATELADLHTLVANATTLGMPGYVQDLANKVVNGDPANQHYLGQTLGNLAVGSSTIQLQDLVNKWFLGMDHPAVTTSGVTYTLAAGTLFGSGPAYNDVVQGQLGDCYFLAALSDIALTSPQTIRNAFIDNGDGTYTVRFFDNGVPDYVTVDRYLPTTSNGAFYYASWKASASNASVKLWVGLYEKAYAQLSESGWSRSPSNANAYASIIVGWEGNVVQQITGTTPESASIFSASTTLNALVSSFQAGKIVLLDSNNVTASGIVADHVYVVYGYNPTTQTFNLWNVWGYLQQLTWTQVVANFDSYTYTT